MVKKCVVGGCSNTTGAGISLHKFPSDSEKSRQSSWFAFVKFTRKDTRWIAGAVKNARVCSAHFHQECYDVRYSNSISMNLDYLAKLKSDAVPTLKSKRKLKDILFEDSSVAGSDTVNSMEKVTKKVRRAYHKREVNRILIESSIKTTPSCDSSQLHLMDLDNDNDPVPFEMDEPLTATPVNCIINPKCHNKRVQADLNVAKIKTAVKGTQTKKKDYVRFRSIGTDIQHDLLLPTEPLRRHDPISKSDDTFPLPQGSSTPRKTSKVTTTFHDTSYQSGSELYQDDQDFDYIPTQDDIDELDETLLNDTTENDETPDRQRKFIVFEEQLLQLFSVCSMCHSSTSAFIKEVKGTFVSIAQECSCGYTALWGSQPFIGTIPAGNLLLSAAVLFSGAIITQSLRVFKHFGLCVIGQNTFLNHQRHYLFPAVEKIWKINTENRFLSLKNCEVAVGGDGRCDSAGHSAKYGAYSLIHLETGHVMDIQLVQSNEVKSSVCMEKEGLIRAVNNLNQHDINIDFIVTDRHPQIQKWIRENLTNTTHCYDVWHVAKGIKKKLTAIANTKDCEDVRSWIKSISNHLYWVAASTTDGHRDMMVSKWKSVSNHIQDIHRHEGKYHSCEHGQLEPRKWLKPDNGCFLLVKSSGAGEENQMASENCHLVGFKSTGLQ